MPNTKQLVPSSISYFRYSADSMHFGTSFIYRLVLFGLILDKQFLFNALLEGELILTVTLLTFIKSDEYSKEIVLTSQIRRHVK